MPDDLFRRDVLDGRQGEWMGTIRIASPTSHWVYAGLGGVIGLVIILFLAFGHYTRHQTVQGTLVPSRGLLSITASLAGTVTRTYAHDGEHVKAGQPLVEISADRDSAKIGLIDALITQSLDNQAALLRSDLDNEKSLVATKKTGLLAKRAMLKSQLAEIASQITIQRQDVASTESVLARFHSIGNTKFISALQMQQQQSTVFGAQAELKTLQRDQVGIEQQLGDVDNQLRQLPMSAVSESNATRTKLADITQELARNAGGRSIILRAPSAGIVSAMVVEPGQAVQQGQSVLSVMPAGSVLRAQMLVPSHAVGFIHPGMRLNLRYNAFPYQEFGQHHGVVLSVSHSALTPEQVLALTQMQTKQPLYRVMVRLDSQNVDVYGRTEHLRPGLALDATVVLDRRRLIQWVFEPLYGLGDNLFLGNHPAPARGTP
ncbi:HlyD family efflux transporter periplasmic adaptor subunit [Acidiphilium acidophilum]|uniref:HlyD family efflux transporter periplasmic adaptor subunit n=1 Tax=Acidiphilium acidophilum TaxID=76588 RepID=UPI002E8E7288|nr:HlyD family efflux transporter periplasmic adaptor subunit [Acidiphilium acidophilum]